jgi:hypothetical protein
MNLRRTSCVRRWGICRGVARKLYFWSSVTVNTANYQEQALDEIGRWFVRCSVVAGYVD